MFLNRFISGLLILVVLFMSQSLYAQVRPRMMTDRPGSTSGNSNIAYDRNGRPMRAQKGNDSLAKRDRYADSITIFFKYYDSSANRTLDSSINDYYKRFPFDWTYNHLGNMGTAAQSLVFRPFMQAGWDPGFHQYDIYNFSLQNTRFFQTTRPYTEFGYALGKRSEQLIDIIHTQNRKDNFNFSIEYRFNNSQGDYQVQNATVNNLRLTAQYKSRNRKYGLQFIYLSNKNASSENGGLINPARLDSLNNIDDPFTQPTRIGNPAVRRGNPFNTTVFTGNTYKYSTLLVRHYLDFGKKDSIVVDSVVTRIFYPRFRVEHVAQVSQQDYLFSDITADSVRYKQYFNYPVRNLSSGDTIRFRDNWLNIRNEFSLLTFPDKQNQNQFIKTGIGVQNLFGKFGYTGALKEQYYNLYAIGEYRNRSRSQVWDIEATGKLYLAGLNAGDYAANLRLQKLIRNKRDALELAFQNVNRTPAFVFDNLSSFPNTVTGGLNKENLTKVSVGYFNSKLQLKLFGNVYLVSNYTYADSFFKAKQEATLFQVLHLGLEKKIKLAKHLNWYLEVHVQQTAGNPPINLPLMLTRNRVAFEGNFFTNLFLSTGLELRYFTPYKGNGYSPFLGTFYYQDQFTLDNRPDAHFFFHFRIKSFKGFVRIEQLNTLIASGKRPASRYNFVAENYPNTGLWPRLGVWWNFIN